MIITKIPNASGAHPAPQNWNKPTPPDGYAVIHDTVDMADFYSHNGFVTLTIEAIEHTRQVDKIVAVEKTKQVEDITYNENDEEVSILRTETYVENEVQTVNEVYTIDTVTSYTPNVEAWEAWKAEQPEPSEPEPTMEERIDALEAQVAQADETAIELFEMQMAQEEINTAQDDALIELYEMIGGL